MFDLVLELLSGEIPARMQREACENLERFFREGLREKKMQDCKTCQVFSTPRRLVLYVQGLQTSIAAMQEEIRGPRVQSSSNAIEGFLRSVGLNLDDLTIVDDKKGAFYKAIVEHPERAVDPEISGIITDMLNKFPWKKSMRWGNGSFRWVRPLHAILCILYDAQGWRVVPVEAGGVISGNKTQGDRLRAQNPITVTSFDNYVSQLQAQKIILDVEERKASIVAQMRQIVEGDDCSIVTDQSLLDETARLVEWPVVLRGQINSEFSVLPQKVLQVSMRQCQKFFSVLNTGTGQIESFLAIANVAAEKNGQKIIQGYERVLRARLSDALFFWKNDCTAGLTAMNTKLQFVTQHHKIGNQKERVERLQKFVAVIAPQIPAPPEIAIKAAAFCKADLTSEMVGEFPELQGVMGGYYAAAEGLGDEVADAICNHYSPAGPRDVVPTKSVTIAVALADKLDTLVSLWAVGEKPTGSGDPFALRRSALGVLRIIVENRLRLDIAGLIESHSALFHTLECEQNWDKKGLISFFVDRFRVWIKGQGFSHETISAVLSFHEKDKAEISTQFSSLDFFLLYRRIQALDAFQNKCEDADATIAAMSRVSNILTYEEKIFLDVSNVLERIDSSIFSYSIENDLFSKISSVYKTVIDNNINCNFEDILEILTSFCCILESFFDKVQIRSDDTIVKQNRVFLILSVFCISNTICDFTKLSS